MMRQGPVSRLLLGIALLIVAGALLMSVGKWFVFAVSPAQSGSNEAIILNIGRGTTPSVIVSELKKSGVISDAGKFVWLGRVLREWGGIKAGEYRLSPAMSPLQIFSILKSGVSMSHPITVREGENMYEVAAELEAKGLATGKEILELCRDTEFMSKLGFTDPLPPSLEGYLFPDTYFFNRDMTAKDMLRQMVKRFQQNWTPADEDRARALGMSRHQVVTLASMIEKETGDPAERPIISSVFHNRLTKKMRLQSDPTTIYGIWPRYHGNIHKRDLSTKTPYNTYTIPALPIGPIANPGKQAIQAALYPAQTDYLFFVSHNDGTHAFSSTYEDHEQYVRKYQIDKSAREGRSWRDLRSHLQH